MRHYALALACIIGLLQVVPVSGSAAPLNEHNAVTYLEQTQGLKSEGSKAVGLGAAVWRRPVGTVTQTLDAFFADVLGLRMAPVKSCAGCGDAIGATPEPTSLLLFGSVLAGLGLVVRRRLRRAGRASQT